MSGMNVIVVSYNFPPVGGAGVQRMAKLVRYLPNFGVHPTVVTVSNPSVPLHDDSILADVPPDIPIKRTRTLEPNYNLKALAWRAAAQHAKAPRLAPGFNVGLGADRLARVARDWLVPDPQILWIPSAAAVIAKSLVKQSYQSVLISGPPFSQFLLAAVARLRRKVGVVLDYRDEWSTYRNSYEMVSGLRAQKVGEALEPRLLRCAHMVVTATEDFAEHLLRRFRFLDEKDVVVIPNGYDPADFPDRNAVLQQDKLVVTYAGTVFKMTSPTGLINALRRLRDRMPNLRERLAVNFIGRVVDTEKYLFRDADSLGVNLTGYLPHTAALQALSASHVALCVLDDVAGVNRMYPAKIFELMYLGRPVLTLAPEGALTKLVRTYRLGHVLHCRDEIGIANWLESSVVGFEAEPGKYGGVSHRADGIEQFDRRRIAGRFASVFAQAARKASC